MAISRTVKTAIGRRRQTLFPFSRKKWQQNKKRDSDYWANEESWRLH